MSHVYTVKENQALILKTQLADGATDRHVRAFLTTETGSVISGSPFTVPHSFMGKHLFSDESTLKFPVGAKEVHAQYVVYSDASFTELTKCYSIDLDIWQKDSSAAVDTGEILEKVCQILNAVASLNQSADLIAVIDTEEIVGTVEIIELTGVIHDIELIGSVEPIDELVSFVHANDELIGILEEDNA